MANGEKQRWVKIPNYFCLGTYLRFTLAISFAVLDNPEPLYLLELLGQTSFFGTPWWTQEPPR
jgi:hypothetical protein